MGSAFGNAPILPFLRHLPSRWLSVRSGVEEHKLGATGSWERADLCPNIYGGYNCTGGKRE